MERSGWSVQELALGVALAALFLAALLVSADREGVASLVAVGHGLCGLALIRAFAEPRPALDRRHCVVTVATLGGLGATEALGAWLHWNGQEAGLGWWFVLGVAFAITGMVTASREEPGDLAFVAQLMFHGLLILPLIVATAQGMVAIFTYDRDPKEN
jgi:hypothetical protein